MGFLLRVNFTSDKVGEVSPVHLHLSDITNSSLFVLHHSVITTPLLVSQESPVFAENSRIALDTISRIVIAIAHASVANMPNINIEVVTPSIVHIVKTAQQHLLHLATNFQSDEWSSDFVALSQMLSYINRRWTVAGKPMPM